MNSCALVNLQNDDGISPPREFRLRYNLRKAYVKSPRELGIAPLKQFLWKYKNFASDKEPKEDGIVPLN